jgi:preprotein translocase subunit SecG
MGNRLLTIGITVAYGMVVLVLLRPARRMAVA